MSISSTSIGWTLLHRFRSLPLLGFFLLLLTGLFHPLLRRVHPAAQLLASEDGRLGSEDSKMGEKTAGGRQFLTFFKDVLRCFKRYYSMFFHDFR